MVDNSDKVPLYIHLPEELAKRLQEQDVDLVAMLRDQGHAIQRSAAHDPTKPAGSKDAALVITASGAALYMAALAVVQIIKAVAGRPVVGELGELKPVLDSKGEVIHDAKGEPVTYHVGEKQILSPDARPVDGTTKISIPSVLEIQVSDR